MITRRIVTRSKKSTNPDEDITAADAFLIANRIISTNITSQRQYFLFQLGALFSLRLRFHGAIMPPLNKYCNVLQIYCRVQLYITSLE